jgi:rhodanese-related sulfurtransferase
MSLPVVSASDAQLLISKGALLIDIRGVDEFAREHIAGAQNIPLPKITQSKLGGGRNAIVFQCKTGARTKMNASALAGSAECDAFLLEGGIEAWKNAGLPVAKDKRQPIELMRQVQITAGSLALLGAVLGYAINPAFYALSGAIGAGLMFSGITGSCAMASVLKMMPWNKMIRA